MKRWMLFGLVAATLTAVGCGRGYVGVYARTAPPPVLVETYWARAEPGRYLDQWILGIRDQQLRLDSGTLGSLSALTACPYVGAQAGKKSRQVLIETKTATAKA